MRDSKNKAKFVSVFTLTMCFVLALIILPVTYAYLTKHKYVGGAITVATISLDAQNSSSTTIVGKTVTLGEADSSDIYNYTAKVKNTGSASVIIRFYVGLINSSGAVVKTTAIEPVLADSSNSSWVGDGSGYYYLSTLAGKRLTVAHNGTYNMLTGFQINDPSGTLDSSIDSDGNVTFGLQIQAVQYNIGSSLSSVWTNIPPNW